MSNDTVSGDMIADATAAPYSPTMGDAVRMFGATTVAAPPERSPAAVAASTLRVKWRYAVPIGLTHLIACLAFVPWFFSWTGAALSIAGCIVFGTLGINLGYHRLLAHRSFTCPRWLECTFIILGVCCLEESPTVWVSVHYQHHRESDQELDPHTPREGLLWAHIGWMVLKSDNAASGPLITRYGKDLIGDPFYAWLEVSDNWIKVAIASWAAFFVAGFAGVALTGGGLWDAVQFGSSLLVWGAAVRTAMVWHATWSVNSVTHRWGYRNYETPDDSRNNLLVAVVASGEGWHNNHHAHMRSARHGHTWREPDLTWLIIRALMALGLARDVVLPSPNLAAAWRSRQARMGAAVSDDAQSSRGACRPDA